MNDVRFDPAEPPVKFDKCEKVPMGPDRTNEVMQGAGGKVGDPFNFRGQDAPGSEREKNIITGTVEVGHGIQGIMLGTPEFEFGDDVGDPDPPGVARDRGLRLFCRHRNHENPSRF